MASIDRLPSGKYRARVYLGDGRCRTFTARTKKEVSRLALEAEAEIAASRIDAPSMTLGEAMERYIESKSAVLSPSTLKAYSSMRRNRMQELHHVRLTDLTQEMVQRAVNADAADHTPKSVRNMHGFLSAVLDQYRHGFRLDTRMPQKTKSSVEIPTEDEVRCVIEYVRGTDMELPILLAACCGMRQSEVVGLRWSAIDLDAGTLEVRTAVVYGPDGKAVEKGTKSEAGQRVIRLIPQVIDALRRAQPSASDDHVVHLTARQIYGRFEAALKSLGIRHYRYHDLRHYLVSVMLSLGVPKSYIADYVGHCDETMIDRVYGHIMASKKTAVEDQLAGHFSGIF